MLDHPILQGSIDEVCWGTQKKSKHAVLHPYIYSDSDDEYECAKACGGNDENSVEGDNDADQDSYFDEAVHSYIESLIDRILPHLVRRNSFMFAMMKQLHVE